MNNQSNVPPQNTHEDARTAVGNYFTTGFHVYRVLKAIDISGKPGFEVIYPKPKGVKQPEGIFYLSEFLQDRRATKNEISLASIVDCEEMIEARLN